MSREELTGALAQAAEAHRWAGLSRSEQRREILADLRERVELLDLAGTTAEIRGFHLATGAVLALIDEAQR